MRRLCVLLFALSVSPATSFAAGFDAFHETVAPPDAAISIQLDRPARLMEMPLAKRVWGILNQSSEIRNLLKTPNLDPVRQVVSYFETQLGTGWEKSFAKLTAGGIALTRARFEKEAVLITLSADSKETLAKFIAAGQQLVRAEYKRQGLAGDPIVTREYRGLTGYKVGGLIYTTQGRRLLASNDVDTLKAAVDRLLDAKSSAKKPTGSRPLGRVTVDLKAARKVLPQDIKDLVKFPSSHKDAAGTLANLGAYLQLFARADKATLDINLTGDGLEIAAVLPTKRSETPEAFTGLIPIAKDQYAPPLLKIPGRIAAASTWFEWHTPWKNRAKLLTEKRVKELEEADRELKQQLSVIGLRALPSEVVTLLGPRWRLAAARQGEIPYRLKPPAKFPAFVIAVDLKNEKEFQRKTSSFFRTFRLIITAENSATPKDSVYKKAQLQTIAFKDGRGAKIDRFAYNFSPTFTVTRGHFIVGSTELIVKQTIDALDIEKEKLISVDPTVTERVVIDFNAAAEATSDFRDLLIQQFVLESGLTIAEAKKEFEILRKAVAALGSLKQEARYDDNGFRYTIRIGK